MSMSSSTTPAMDLALQTLQPIRDLSRNWDVDIASCLEEYLQELTGMSHTSSALDNEGIPIKQQTTSSDVDGHHDSVPNFAHAALILQNSSHVYSRKVEYLHSLVYKALQDFLQSTAAMKNSNNSSSSRRRKSADSDIEEFYDFDPHENFLLLDDVIPQDDASRKQINLKDDDDGIGAGSSPNTNRRDRTSSITTARTRLSLGGLSVTRLERSTFGGGFSSLQQQQQRALLGILNNGTLRLVGGHCDVGEDGTLLMPGSQTLKNTEPVAESFATGQPRNLFGPQGEENIEPFPAENIGIDDDDDNEGPGFAMNLDDDDQDQDADHSLVDHPKLVQESVGGHKKVTFARGNIGETLPTQHKKNDPWELLDPHSHGGPSYKPKPLKKGKTIRLPKGITQLPSECVTGARTSRVVPPRPQALKVPTLRPCFPLEAFRVAIGDQLEPTLKVSLCGLFYEDEFRYIATENAKLKAAKRRVERKTEKETLKESGEFVSNKGQNNFIHHEEDDDDDGGGFDFGGGDDGDYDNEDNGNDNAVGNFGFQSVDDVFRGSHDDEDHGHKNTFEELCRAHIAAFAKGAEKFALSNKLTERVAKWQEHLAPILEEEERRASFDIHHYSRVLIEQAVESLRGKRTRDGSMRVSDSSSIVDFKTVTKGCTRSDVCRFFLASLSLANGGNLKIEERSESYQFVVISETLEMPTEAYRAPSLRSKS